MKTSGKLFLFTILLLLLFIPMPVLAASANALWDSYSVPSTRQKPRLLDNADLLSADEEEDILSKLDSISMKWSSDVVILTTDEHNGSIQDFADDYFDYNGFGSEYNESGILFMLSMDTREYAISTSGSAIYVFTDYGQELLMEKMLPYLSGGNYYEAFNCFIDTSDIYYDSYSKGNPVDYNYQPKTSGDILRYALISIAIGLVVAVFPVVFMASSLSTVHMKPNAAGYQSHQGLQMTLHEDIYLRSHIDKRLRSQDNGSSSGRSGSHHGGSSMHTSSSGHSHGGSHGHF